MHEPWQPSQPPWRRAVGRAFFAIDSEFGDWTGESLFPHPQVQIVEIPPAPPPEPPPDAPPPPDSPPPPFVMPPSESPPPEPPDSPPDEPLPEPAEVPLPRFVSEQEYAAAEKHATIYLDIIQETYGNFSEEPVGRLGYERGTDWDKRPVDQRPVGWAWDNSAGMETYGLLPDETTIAFEEHEARGRPCWNCGKIGHIYTKCPEPLDRARINAARGDATRDQTRSLELLDRFQPGVVSDDLHRALFARDDDDPEDMEMDDEFTATRQDYPWFEGMLKWGYPPGWIASKGGFAAKTER